MSETCHRCGGDVLATGLLIAPAPTSAQPRDTRGLTLPTRDIVTKATMCRSCGAFQIIGDRDSRTRLATETADGSEQVAASVVG
jgi:hypothetical protein